MSNRSSIADRKVASSAPSDQTTRLWEDKLEELALRKIARLIKAGKAQNIVILTGAGISTSAGIPDFRSPDTGLYANLEKLDLPTPEAVFDIDYFRKRPEPFWTLAKDLYPGKYLPTPTHHFLSLLSSHSLLLRLFTQNIDTLETIAGVPPDRIVEAHGSFGSARCIDCGREYGREYVLAQGVRRGQVVRCLGEGSGSVRAAAAGDGDEDATRRSGDAKAEGKDHGGSAKTASPAQRGKKGRQSASLRGGGCGGLVKPDIVFFGEGLPDRFFERTPDLAKADLLIIIGTSLQVAPFCRLPSRAPPNCPRILINREAVGEFTLTERRQERYFAIQRRKEEHAAKRAGKGQQKVAGTHSGKGGSEKRSKESLTVIEGAMAKMSLGGVTAQKADNAATAGNRDKAGSTEKAAEEARKLASDIREEAVPTAPEASGTTPAITMQPTAVPSQPAKEAGKAERNAEPDAGSESDYSDDGYDDRDAFYKGDADTAMCRLAEMLGWREELEGRIDKINARLRREWTMSA